MSLALRNPATDASPVRPRPGGQPEALALGHTEACAAVSRFFGVVTWMTPADLACSLVRFICLCFTLVMGRGYVRTTLHVEYAPRCQWVAIDYISSPEWNMHTMGGVAKAFILGG